MKKLLASLLILCMIPAVCFARTTRDLKEALFYELCATVGLPASQRTVRDGDTTYILFDHYAVASQFKDDETIVHASLACDKALDFDFISYALCMTYAFYGTEYQDTFLTAIMNFSNGEGEATSSDGKLYIKLMRLETGEILLYEIAR